MSCFCMNHTMNWSCTRSLSYLVLLPFSRQLAEFSPYFEAMKKRDVEVLFLYEPFDELVLYYKMSFLLSSISLQLSACGVFTVFQGNEGERCGGPVLVYEPYNELFLYKISMFLYEPYNEVLYKIPFLLCSISLQPATCGVVAIL